MPLQTKGGWPTSLCKLAELAHTLWGAAKLGRTDTAYKAHQCEFTEVIRCPLVASHGCEGDTM